jgi:hypothetical protein
VSRYKVLIDDNFHFMNEDYRVTSGVFDTVDEAVAACKLIVDECLEPMLQPGMTARALYEQYEGFGDDPFAGYRSIPTTRRWPSRVGDIQAAVRGPGRATTKLPPESDDVTAPHAGTVISIVGVKAPKAS